MKTQNKFLVFCLVSFFTYCSQNKKTGDIVIVATTDFHASIDQAESFSSVIFSLREKFTDRMIHLDGGDLFQGSLEGNLSKGRAMITLYNLLKVDAVAVGNHELDYGPNVEGRVVVKSGEDPIGAFRARTQESQFKWLSVNFIYDSPSKNNFYKNALDQKTIFPPHAVFQKAGNKVCVIGATTPTTPQITRPFFVKGTRFEPLKPTVEAQAKFLREKEKCDFVILTAHAGLLCDKIKPGEFAGACTAGMRAGGASDNARCVGDKVGRKSDTIQCQNKGSKAEILKLLEELPPKTLDAVVAGHTHEQAQEIIHGTPVIEAGSYAKVVGVLHLFKSNKKFYFEPFVEIPAHADSPSVTKAMYPFREKAAKIKEKIVGVALEELPKKHYEESAFGNFLADAIFWVVKKHYKVDACLLNAGGIRAGLPSGPIHYGNLYKTLPFDNTLAVVKLTGFQLKDVLRIASSGMHGLPAISGLTFKRYDIVVGKEGSWDRDLNQDGIKDTWERDLLFDFQDSSGKAIEDKKIYKLALPDFLVEGGDHQGVVINKIPKLQIQYHEGIWLRDLVVEYLKSHPKINPQEFFNSKKPRINLVPAPTH